MQLVFIFKFLNVLLIYLFFLAEIDAQKINSACSEILEYASDSESDVEPALYNSVWHGQNADLSDNESIDSEFEDVLKYGNQNLHVIVETNDNFLTDMQKFTQQKKYVH